MNICQKIKNIQGWELRKGKNELLRHIEGGNKPLTLKEANYCQVLRLLLRTPGRGARLRGQRLPVARLYALSGRRSKKGAHHLRRTTRADEGQICQKQA